MQPKHFMAIAFAGLTIVILSLGIFVINEKQKDLAPSRPLPAPAGKNEEANETQTPEELFCRMDAKICPDGSSVGRVAPNCDFAPCPKTGSTGCGREGEQIGTMPAANGAPGKICCPGLSAIPVVDEETRTIIADIVVCTYCGDGKCREPENQRNCGADCE